MIRHSYSWPLAGLFTVFFFNACSPVNFSSESKKVEQQSTNAISCSPRINGSTAALTMSTTDANPSLTANCDPSSVNYTWSVERSNTPVTINGLTGATSTPDFRAAGPGTYYIRLVATANGLTEFRSSTPLEVTVTGGGGLPNITCDPRMNGSLTSINLTTTNPTIAANCNPAGVAYVWTVTRNGSPVVVSGLTGSSSTPDFLAAGSGTYQVWLAANLSGYNSFTSSSALTVVVPTVSSGRSVDETFNITVANNKLDVLVIVDDSSSMLGDNQKLASRLEAFVNNLSTQGFDWQMCATLTRAQRVSSSDPTYYWGASVVWNGNTGSTPWILKSGTSNPYQIFMNTINQIGAGWAGTNDERAIKAAWWHLWNGEPGVTGTSGCYRPDAGLSVIILSDEDERSIGGDQTQAYYADERNLPLETDDLPATYVNYVKQVFGNSKRFTVNSIIVRPGDTACMIAQDAQNSKAHYGVKYNELSQLTGGYVGSICDTDYSSNLNYFVSAITRSQASVPLQCSPVGNTVTETVTPAYTHTTSIVGQLLQFNPQIPAGSSVRLQYRCP